jgi:hypothetical protein
MIPMGPEVETEIPVNHLQDMPPAVEDRTLALESLPLAPVELAVCHQA